METKHTKGKWRIIHSNDGSYQIDSDKNKTPYVIATVVRGRIFTHRSDEETKANAEIIVKSVNAYDELILALESIQNSPYPTNEREIESWLFTARNIAETTLQKVVGTKMEEV